MVDWQWQNLGIGKAGVTTWMLDQKERLLLEGAVKGADERKGRKGKKEKGEKGDKGDKEGDKGDKGPRDI